MARPAPIREDLERGLTILALTGDNSLKAAELLKANGTPVPSRTLRTWRTQHADRYNEIRETRKAEIDKVITAEARNIAISAQDAAREAIDLERKRIHAGETKDAAGAARNLATTAAIMVDKTLVLEGKPTSIIQHKTGDEILRSLAQYGQVIEGTAEETTDNPRRVLTSDGQ